ncbi:hypothetical protein ACDZ28_03895 [Paenibacillus sp. RS8]|uniref:hypothetical protein n=1 Tax=Paenibacillus sp. RS8 TaxID=3242681 RepID=UPI0035C01D16
MMKIDMNDLSLIASIKSELMFIIGQLEDKSNDYKKDEVARSIQKIVIDIFDFEKGVTEEFFSGKR